MAKKLSAKDKLAILEIVLLPPLMQQTEEAIANLEQAKEDWVQFNSCDGDREKVKKNPILSVVEGRVALETANNIIAEIKRLVGV